jgi:nucleotide-binding universal stress UspA family protein
MKWKRILVAIDFSPPSKRALESARALAVETGGTLVLLHVVSPPVALYPQEAADLGALSEAWMREARRDLLRIATRARRGGRRVRVETRFGAPWRAIVDVAEELAADAICIGRSGHSRVERLALGSTAERVVRTATVPVIVTGDRPVKRLSRVLAAVDLGEGSAAGLRLARRLSARGARLEALFVVPPGSGAGARAPLREFLELHGADPREGTIRESDDVAGRILDREREIAPDLIVIATQGRLGLDRWLLGSVAEKVVRHAEAPVLAIPWAAAEQAMRALSRESRARTKRARPAPSVERPHPAGRRTRGPWSGQAHTGRGGPAGRRGGGP